MAESCHVSPLMGSVDFCNNQLHAALPSDSSDHLIEEVPETDSSSFFLWQHSRYFSWKTFWYFLVVCCSVVSRPGSVFGSCYYRLLIYDHVGISGQVTHCWQMEVLCGYSYTPSYDHLWIEYKSHSQNNLNVRTAFGISPTYRNKMKTVISAATLKG